MYEGFDVSGKTESRQGVGTACKKDLKGCEDGVMIGYTVSKQKDIVRR